MVVEKLPSTALPEDQSILRLPWQAEWPFFVFVFFNKLLPLFARKHINIFFLPSPLLRKRSIKLIHSEGRANGQLFDVVALFDVVSKRAPVDVE